MKTEETVPLTAELEARLRELDARHQEVARGFVPLDADPEFVFAGLQLEAVHEVNKAMEQEGITQAELAKRLGCSRQNVHRMLTDEANFKLEMLAKLAVALGRDVALRLLRKSEEVVVREACPAADQAQRLKQMLDDARAAEREGNRRIAAYQYEPVAAPRMPTATIINILKAA